jgi:succinoglycan biosynthesis transport protein ExoP
MNPLLFLLAIRARFRVFALVLAATILAATTLSLLLPKTYKAAASLVVDVKNEQWLSSPLDPSVAARERIVGYLQTQVDVITSDKVARKVVEDLKLAERSVRVGQNDSKESIEDRLVADLLGRVEVRTSQSSVIQVSFTDRDRHVAASVANAFAKAYVDTMLELRVEPARQAAVWFDAQLRTLRTKLEDAQARLTEYQQRTGIVVADEQADVDYPQLADLTSQLVMARVHTGDLQAREQQARAALAQGGMSLELLPDIQSNEHIRSLRQKLLSAEAELQESSPQYGKNHPSYLRLRAERDSQRRELEAEMRNVVEGISTAIHQSQQRETVLEAAIATRRAGLLARRESRNQAAVLVRNVETARNAYDTALQRSVISGVEARASQASVGILSLAAVPRAPDRPNIALNVALATIVGTMLGTGIVIAMEMADRRVRSLADLDEGIGVPLLAVIDGWDPAERKLHGFRRAFLLSGG